VLSRDRETPASARTCVGLITLKSLSGRIRLSIHTNRLPPLHETCPKYQLLLTEAPETETSIEKYALSLTIGTRKGEPGGSPSRLYETLLAPSNRN
jgi:hypothetical protein